MQRIIIEEIQCTSGYLEQATVKLSRNLNCIIGARGTCKSTLVETLRYAVENDDVTAEILRGTKGYEESNPYFGLIRETLRSGTVRCTISVQTPADESTITVERDADSDTKLYRDGVRELTDRGILRSFEIYSQGDLQRLADGEKDRLDLIDKPNGEKIAVLKNQRRDEGDRLREIGEKLKSVRERISKLRTDLRSAPDLERELAAAVSDRPTLSDELEAARAGYLSRTSALTALTRAIAALDDANDQPTSLHAARTVIDEVTSQINDLKYPEIDPVSSTLAKARTIVDQMLTLAAELQVIDLATAHWQLKEEFDRRNEAYYRLQRERDEVNDAIKREDHLRRQVDHMNGLHNDLSKLLEEETRLLGDRSDHRARFTALSDQIYELRLQQVETINAAHSELVFLKLHSGALSAHYVELLAELLSGSRIREQREVAESISQRITPFDLIDIVESGDSKLLANLIDRDLGQINRVVSHLTDHDRLYDLEGRVLEDRLDIFLLDSGTSKPIETLSKGQKATALLPLILRPLPYPLIIDQPEDDLDNSFIFRSLVETVRSLKLERQIIFVTHNANIPVLAEAEQVIVMTMLSPTAANPPRIGTVDGRKQEILDLLEGGAEAFERRRSRYFDES